MKKIRPRLLEFSRRLSLVAPRLGSSLCCFLFVAVVPHHYAQAFKQKRAWKSTSSILGPWKKHNELNFSGQKSPIFTQLSPVYYVKTGFLHFCAQMDNETFLSDFPTWQKKAGERSSLNKKFRSKGFFSHYETLKWLSLWFWQPF